MDIAKVHRVLNWQILQVVLDLEYMLVLMNLGGEGGVEGYTVLLGPPNMSRGLYSMVNIQVLYPREK